MAAKMKNSDMISRFTFKQAALAAKISNEIAEGIDGGDSMKSLRMAVSYWSDVACVEAQQRFELEARLNMFIGAKGLMDSALKNLGKAQKTHEQSNLKKTTRFSP